MPGARILPRHEPGFVEPAYGALGLQLRRLRERAGLTQEDLAARVGLTRVSICNIELGRQRLMLHDVARFAEAMRTSPQKLLKGIFW